MKKLLILPIKLYRLCISPMLLPSCRFAPSCSEYAMEAIENHGWRGIIMAAKRLSRCHPFGRSGFDPVLHSPPSSRKPGFPKNEIFRWKTELSGISSNLLRSRVARFVPKSCKDLDSSSSRNDG